MKHQMKTLRLLDEESFIKSPPKSEKKRCFCTSSYEYARNAEAKASLALEIAKKALEKTATDIIYFNSEGIIPAPQSHISGGKVILSDRKVEVILFHQNGLFFCHPSVYNEQNELCNFFISSFKVTRNNITLVIELTGINFTGDWKIIL